MEIRCLRCNQTMKPYVCWSEDGYYIGLWCCDTIVQLTTNLWNFVAE